MLSAEFRHLGPSAVNPASDRARQRIAFADQKNFGRDCIALRLLRSSRLQSDFQPHRAHDSVTLATPQSRGHGSPLTFRLPSDFRSQITKPTRFSKLPFSPLVYPAPGNE